MIIATHDHHVFVETWHFVAIYDRTLSCTYLLHDLLSPTPLPSSRVCRHAPHLVPSSPSGASSSSSRGHTHIPYCNKHLHDHERPHMNTFGHRPHTSFTYLHLIRKYLSQSSTTYRSIHLVPSPPHITLIDLILLRLSATPGLCLTSISSSSVTTPL